MNSFNRLSIVSRRRETCGSSAQPGATSVSVTIRDNSAECRCEIYYDENLGALVAYRLTEGRIAFMHTETDPAFGGRRLARRLVEHALVDVRERGLEVLPFYPYVRKVIAGNPERFLGLVPVSEHERFDLPANVGYARRRR